MRLHAPFLLAVFVVACGGNPPPKVEEPKTEETSTRRPGGGGPTPQMSQELGSIDQKKVEQTFAKLTMGPLETCHKQGRDRIEFLTGDVKVFLRIDGDGRMKYGFFEDTTIGDRETEKCILNVFQGATWPKPEGGEAEIRNGFGWGPGGERAPTNWASDKVTGALMEAKAVRREVDKCKAGVKGDFRVTAYVEAAEEARIDGDDEDAHQKAKPGGKPKPAAPAAPTAKPAAPGPGKKGEAGGKFKAIGIAPPNKDGAEKVDCIVDALKTLDLPSPGSYAAKVTFSL